MSSMADLLPMANSLSPTNSLRCFSHLIIAESASLLRVVPKVLGLIFPVRTFQERCHPNCVEIFSGLAADSVSKYVAQGPRLRFDGLVVPKQGLEVFVCPPVHVRT